MTSLFEPDLPEFIRENQLLHEERIFVDRSKQLTISVDGSGETTNNFADDPYIKVYRTTSPNSNTPAIRISVNAENDGPRYIVHNNQNGTLNSKEKKWLDDAMKNGISNGDRKYKGIDVWDAVKNCIIDKSTNITEEQKEKINNMKCPDFTVINPAK